MALSGKERQRKWQEKQKAFGKKRVTVVIDKEALSVLEKEKARTGESFSDIVSRALMEINEPIHEKVSDNVTIGSRPGAVEIVSDNKMPKDHSHLDQAIERIVSMIGVIGLSPEEVAERLNDEKVAPPVALDSWDATTVNELYMQATTPT